MRGFRDALGRCTAKAYELAWRLIAARRTIILPAPAINTSDCSPVFLVGCPRSGTTLLRVMLDSHPRLSGPPESFFMLELEKLWTSPDAMNGLLEMGYDRAHVRGQLRQFASYFLQGYAVTHGKQRVVEKTPHYIACLPFIEELFGPQSQYVMLYRHPLDVVLSLVRHWSIGWHPQLRNYLDQNADPHVAYAHFWADHMNKMLAFEAEHPDRCKRMRYEDLVARPEENLRSLLAFMNEAWSEDVLLYYEKEHDPGRGDRQALIQKGIVPSVNNWHSLSPALVAEIQEIVQLPAARLGYGFSVNGTSNTNQAAPLAGVAR